MTEQDPMLEPFEALIGTWATEATHPLVDVVVPGSITFEWLEGGRFLIQRSRNDHELFPDAICVIDGTEGGRGPVMELRLVCRAPRTKPPFACAKAEAPPIHCASDGVVYIRRCDRRSCGSLGRKPASVCETSGLSCVLPAGRLAIPNCHGGYAAG